MDSRKQVAFTKANFPRVAEFYWHMQQTFDAVRTYAKDGENECGEKWQGKGVMPVLEQRK